MKTLLDAQLNEEVVIKRIVHEASIRRRLMDLGFMKDVLTIPVLDSPSRGMRAYFVKGCKIALRDVDSAGIQLVEEGDEDAV